MRRAIEAREAQFRFLEIYRAENVSRAIGYGREAEYNSIWRVINSRGERRSKDVRGSSEPMKREAERVTGAVCSIRGAAEAVRAKSMKWEEMVVRKKRRRGRNMSSRDREMTIRCRGREWRL